MKTSLHTALAAAAVAVATFGQARPETGIIPASRPLDSAVASRPAAERHYVRIGDLPGVREIVRFSSRMVKGAQPENAEGFAALNKLGVTAVLSVEEPDQRELDQAKVAGISITNVPTEYAGFPDTVVQDIIERARAIPGPFYIHCHHGKHRGGTAAAILRMTFEGVSTNEAIAELAELGCSARYDGLFETVRRYRPDPTKAHRVLEARGGITGLTEVTPRLFRGVTTLDAAALAALKTLDIDTIMSADLTPEQATKLDAQGFRVVRATIAGTAPTAAELTTIKAMLPGLDRKVFVYAAKDGVQAGVLIAAERLARSGWSGDEAAREVEAMTPGSAEVAAAIRAAAPTK